VGVAAAAGVAFGGDQHVLAERRQMIAAQRTAVRRGLAVRGAAHRPPGRRGKTRGHTPILAPRAPRARPQRAGGPPARALAALAIGVGVGLALWRAERERRAAAEQREGHPSTGERSRRGRRSQPRESPTEALRRALLAQLDGAIALLERYPRETRGRQAQTVHELRKTVKRVRALLGLLRGELGEERFARENAALRDCARRLAGARDAEVLVETFDALVRRHRKQLAGKRGVARLRGELLAERERAVGVEDGAVRAAVLEALRGVRARVLAWELRPRSGRRGAAKLLGAGLRRVYGRGRGRLRRARRHADVQTLHALRKSAKDLRYVAETLAAQAGERERRNGAGKRSSGRQSAGRRKTKGKSAKAARKAKGKSAKAARRIERVARAADGLGDVLGEEHDLALLERVVRERFAGKRRTRKRLLKLIARRRRRLRREALDGAEQLYRHKPERFVRRVRAAL
jgi:CHAD domain-containing protein